MSVNYEEQTVPAGRPDFYKMIGRDVVGAYVDELTQLDGEVVLAALVPHDTLPLFDAAGLIMSHHYHRSNTFLTYDIEPNSSYDLGVLFGRGLMRCVQPQDLPIVSGIDAPKESAVLAYLRHSKKVASASVALHYDPRRRALNDGVLQFAVHCNQQLPQMMRYGTKELRHGVNDYLNVIRLLEAKPDDLRLLRRKLIVGAHAGNALFRLSRLTAPR